MIKANASLAGNPVRRFVNVVAVTKDSFPVGAEEPIARVPEPPVFPLEQSGVPIADRRMNLCSSADRV
jgi:hypothetical protein